MRKSDKIKNIEEANKRLLGENFDIDSYEETVEGGRGELLSYLESLGSIGESQINNIMSLADSYADDMWREGAQGGFAPK